MLYSSRQRVLSPGPLLMACALCLATSLTLADSKAFSQPSAELPAAQRLDFKVGRGFFKRLWVTAPASTQAADGLGPLYNARSCMGCHPGNGRGSSPVAGDRQPASVVVRVDVPSTNEAGSGGPEPTYGMQIQTRATPGHAAEGRIDISYVEETVSIGSGETVVLRRPAVDISEPGYGPLQPDARLSLRVAPQLIGLGLLERITVDDIVAHADPEDRDGDGISGRPHWVQLLDSGEKALGRYGYKAGIATVEGQVQAAFHDDLGLSVPMFPNGHGDCTDRQQACLDAPNGNSPQYDDLEVHQQVVDLVTLYTSNLSVPAQRSANDPDVVAGREVFERTGCQSCHVPTFQIESVEAGTDVQEVAPYTDLLLHDMGPGLADNRPQGQANGREWRTAPLWGIGLTKAVTGEAHYLHDGRARTLLEAILWHGGEAQAQRDAVAALPPAEREQLLTFLESL